jgi:hypothetical protein
VAPWLRPGITVGFISGGVWLVYNLVNNLGDLSGGQNAALSVAGLGVTVSLFTLAGFRGSARTGRVRTGALTGLWAALVSSTVGITTLWAITLAAMDTIRRNGLMVADYLQSGMQDMDAFIIQDALGGSAIGLVVSLSLGAILGTLGALIGRAREWLAAK